MKSPPIGEMSAKSHQTNAESADPVQKRNSETGEELSHIDVLIFSLEDPDVEGAETLIGVELRFVLEAFRTGHITPIPLAPQCVAGATNLRGQVVPLVLLSAFMPNMEVQHPLHGTDALLVEWSGLKAGFPVEQIIEVYRFPLSRYRSDKNSGIIFPGFFDSPHGAVRLLDVGAALKDVSHRTKQKAKNLSGQDG